ADPLLRGGARRLFAPQFQQANPPPVSPLCHLPFSMGHHRGVLPIRHWTSIGAVGRRVLPTGPEPASVGKRFCPPALTAPTVGAMPLTSPSGSSAAQAV